MLLRDRHRCLAAGYKGIHRCAFPDTQWQVPLETASEILRPERQARIVESGDRSIVEASANTIEHENVPNAPNRRLLWAHDIRIGHSAARYD